MQPEAHLHCGRLQHESSATSDVTNQQHYDNPICFDSLGQLVVNYTELGIELTSNLVCLTAPQDAY